jgi:hypothetical protein
MSNSFRPVANRCLVVQLAEHALVEHLGHHSDQLSPDTLSAYLLPSRASRRRGNGPHGLRIERMTTPGQKLVSMLNEGLSPCVEWDAGATGWCCD